MEPEGEDDFIDLKCLYCGKDISFPESDRGLARDCPECRQTLVVVTGEDGFARKFPIPIMTPRLLLRRFEEADVESLVEIFSDEELFEYEDNAPDQDPEHIRKWILQLRFNSLAAGQPLHLGVVFRENEKLIGYVTLSSTDARTEQAMLGIMLRRDYHRKGLGSEAIRALLELCFQGVGMHRVVTAIDAGNEASRKLWLKLGMRCEGHFLQDRVRNGEWIDTEYYAILGSEYRKEKVPPASNS